MTDFGREVRRQMRGPYGEEYEHFDDREQKFRKIDMLAREKKFD